MSNHMMEEFFRSVDIIVDERLKQESFSRTINGIVIERVKGSDSYRVRYQNAEIMAISMGGSYDPGDEVTILIPDRRMEDVKFILGRTNSRVPSMYQGPDGELSSAVVKEIQDALDIIADIASDDVISPSEKTALQIQWKNLQASYGALMNESKKHPEVKTDLLTERYKELEEVMELILENMDESTEFSGDELRRVFGEYYEIDREVYSEVLDAILNKIGYRVELSSSRGTIFLDGEGINTVLRARVYRGQEDITADLPEESFVWIEYERNGKEIERHEGIGSLLTIFRPLDTIIVECEIHID